MIDFIDMERPDHKRQVLEAQERALRRDRSRTKIVGLSELGLLQLTRKRTRMGLGAALTRACGACAGSGRVKTPETVAHEALSEVRRVVGPFTSGDVTIRTHPEVARALRLALQTASPFLEGGVLARLRVEDDAAARSDQFDLSVG